MSRISAVGRELLCFDLENGSDLRWNILGKLDAEIRRSVPGDIKPSRICSEIRYVLLSHGAMHGRLTNVNCSADLQPGPALKQPGETSPRMARPNTT